MTLKLIEAEIRRFLSKPGPEVLCIKGRWGVGKTYSWKKFLEEARRAQAVALNSYSYVSLFGLNSLDDLRFSIFESKVSGDKIGSDANEVSFNQLVNKGSDFARRMKPAIEVMTAFFNRKGVTDVLFKSAFLTVHDQLICLDDLERAGSGLDTRDVLGLASFLKEARRCKVVLLLNDQEHDQKEEFERQLEKVADVTLIFDLTPEEAVQIALTSNELATSKLKPRIVDLGITNIRVIKRIERLAEQLVQILAGSNDDIIEEAVATLALASWAVQQPSEAPTLDFIKAYNRISIAFRAGREEPDQDTIRFRQQIDTYPFAGLDALGRLVLDGAAAGFFQAEAIQRLAEEKLQEQQKHSRGSKFTEVWHELYHGSLATDDDTFLDAMFESSIEEADSITPLNINGAVRILREYGRSQQADAVIENYVVAHEAEGFEFFDIRRHHFTQSDNLDEKLRDAFAAKRKTFVDNRDPLMVLTSIDDRRGWGDGDVALLRKLSADDFERIFESLSGETLRPAIEMTLAIGNSQLEDSPTIQQASIEALRRIAAKSPIRARKVAGFGVRLDANEES